MENFERVLKKALSLTSISKKEKEKMLKLADRIKKILEKKASKYNAEPILAGSLFRNTLLPDKKEFDIFIRFPKDFSKQDIERINLSLAKHVVKIFKGRYFVNYAEHPYVRAKISGLSIDIVPCYKVEDPLNIISSVDRTPFHVKYLKERMNEDLAKEVRILKLFLKSNDLYGAEAKVQGISGYGCELLILYYKKFLNLLKNIERWKVNQVIDLENLYKKNLKDIVKKFKKDCLILIDPIDRNRNVTSALSSKNFFKLKNLAKNFLEKPSIKFFKKSLKPISPNQFLDLAKKRKTRFVLIVFKRPNVVEDILWPQLRKFSERISNILEERKYEFKVFGKDVYSDEKNCYVFIEMEIFELPKVQKRIGPSIFDLKGSKEFLKKYENELTYVEKDRWVVEINRKFLSAEEKISDTLSKNLEILKKKGIPSHIAASISKRFYIISDLKKICKIIEKNKDFGIFLRKYFYKL